MMQNALQEYIKSKMTGGFAQSTNLLQHDPQYQAVVASFMNGNLTDGSSKVPQTSLLGQNCSQMHQSKQELFTARAQPVLKDNSALLNGVQQEPLALRRKNKRAREDVSQESVLNEHVLQKIFRCQNSLESERDQTHTLFQHNVIQNQNQQAPQFSGFEMRHHQQQIRHPILQQEMVRQATPVHWPGVCSHRLMEYLYCIRNRPNDNNIAFWRTIVAEFYDPCAKRRWCLSSKNEVGEQSPSLSSFAAMASFSPCGLCNCQSGRMALEVSFEVLPRLSKITFEGGVVDEILFLDMPRERRFSSGLLMLECERAVQESVYERNQVVHEGRLRIIFSPNLKMLSWEFCTRSHEVFLRRTSVAPQVSELVNAVRDYQNLVNDRGSDGASSQDVKPNCNKILEVGGQIEKALYLDGIDRLGFSKKFSRFLQMADIVHSMKDLMNLCQNKGTGPIDILNCYGRKTPLKLPKKKVRGKSYAHCAQDLPEDTNKLMASPRFNANQSCSSFKSEAFSNVPDSNPIMSRDSKWRTSLNQCTPPFQDPNTTNSGSYKISVGNGLSNSKSSMHQDAMQNLMQEIMNSQVANRNARDEVIWGSTKCSAVDMPSRVLGHPSAAATLGNVVGSMPVGIHQPHSDATLTRNLSEVHGNCPEKFLLPESGFSASHGYYDHNKFYGNDHNMNYGWKA